MDIVITLGYSLNSCSSASAGGQELHPWLVNNSTTATCLLFSDASVGCANSNPAASNANDSETNRCNEFAINLFMATNYVKPRSLASNDGVTLPPNAPIVA